MPRPPRARACVAALFTALAADLAADLPGQTPAWAGKVDALVAEALAQPFAVGFSVGVALRGEVLHARGYGTAELEHGVPAGDETMFRIGSITKQFTAALVMRAVEAGRVTLDDELGEHVASFPLQGRTVTLRHLLNHSSGIPSYTGQGEAWQKAQPFELPPADVLALVADKPFDFEPGTDFRYNNTGYYLLGMVLEALHGKPFAAIVHDELAVPLGLRRTRHDSNRELIPDRAQGYAVAGERLGNDDTLAMSLPAAAGALLSTGGDLARWSAALAGGMVVQPASHAQMTTPLVIDGRDHRYGFGLMLGEIEELPCVMHGGGISGFNSFLVHVPSQDLHVAVISNSERASSRKLANAIVRAVLDVPAFVAKDLPIPAELRAAAAGDYVFAGIGMGLSVHADGERLVARGDAEGQAPFRLLFQGGREFRADFDHSMKLELGADGTLALRQNGRLAHGVRR